MRLIWIVVLSVAAIVSAVAVTGRYGVKGNVVVADGSDPMPFCRKVVCPPMQP